MRVWWVRAALGVVFVPASLLMLGSGAMLLSTESVGGVLGALLCLFMVLFIGLVWFVGTRIQFLVDDEGITKFDTVRAGNAPRCPTLAAIEAHRRWNAAANARMQGRQDPWALH